MMDGLSQGSDQTPTLHCIDEVRVAIPLERLEEVVEFYTSLLGLSPWPGHAQIPGGLGLGDPQCGLYLQYRHDPRVEPMQRRFTLVVSSLAGLEERLSEHPWPFERYRGLSFTDQWLLVSDPVGHLIQIRQSQSLL